jgi:hypothetical protein
MWSYLVAFALVSLIGSLASIRLLRIYGSTGEGDGRSGGWSGRWSFTPAMLGVTSGRLLAVASLLVLFLELLLIRWISSEIRIFAYLKNFVLIACFLGFGLGACLCRRRVSLLCLCAPLVLLTSLVAVPIRPLRAVIDSLPVLLTATSEIYVWGVGAAPLAGSALVGLLMAALIALPIFALIAICFIPAGQIVGWCLEQAPNGNRGYSINVLASLAGIVLYTLLAFLNQPPISWFAIAGSICAVLVWRSPFHRKAVIATFLSCVALLAWGRTAGTHWSPYQKLTIGPVTFDGEVVAYDLQTNGFWHQKIIDLSAGFVAAHPVLFQGAPIELNAYNIPYRFVEQPRSVLILGAGMGNDVAAALRAGAGRVAAVEIDPTIVALGRRLHFEKPYDSPRVRLVLDDARAYVQNAREAFDLIVYSLLDSHTTHSSFSSIRIDNYVYTKEAVDAARRLLSPEGVLIVKFQVQRPWIAGRLRDTLTAVFGREPLQIQGDHSGLTTSGSFFVAGSQDTIRRALSDERFAAYVAARSSIPVESAAPTTDDWPFFYQKHPGIPTSVAVISFLILVLGWMAVRNTGLAGRSIRWHFFFLGAGFMLLEALIISRMALLFGTTWVVNSVVIGALMLLIVAANLVGERFPRLPVPLLYLGIAVSIAVAFALPLQSLFFASPIARAVAAAVLLGSPVFFAGLVFIRGYAQAGFAGDALGSNLLGALAGGLLESLSLWTGLRALLIVAALLYGLSLVALRAHRGLVQRPIGIPLGRGTYTAPGRSLS